MAPSRVSLGAGTVVLERLGAAWRSPYLAQEKIVWSLQTLFWQKVGSTLGLYLAEGGM